MTKKRETTLHEAIIDWIHANVPQSNVEKRHGSPFAKVGNPDITGCIQGKHCELEIKTGSSAPEKIQGYRLRKWKEAGAITGTAWSVMDAIQILKEAGIQFKEKP